MKKLRRILLLTICFLALSYRVCLVWATETVEPAIPENMALSVIPQQLSQEERAVLLNQENHTATMQGIDLEKAVIWRTYNVSYWQYAHLPLDDLLTKVKSLPKRAQTNYWILAESPVAVCTFQKDGTTTVNVMKTDDGIPQYVTDILNMKETEVFQGKVCHITGIYCFDNSASQGGTIVYIATDNGTYVKYYEWATSDAMLLSEGDFQTLGKAYYKQSTSHGNNFSLSGAPLNGTTTFSDFVEHYDEYVKQKQTLWITIGVIVLITAVTVGTWVIEGKKADTEKSCSE